MTQRTKILKHLQDYGTITALQAMESYRCFRLAAVIFNLREEGNLITTDMIHYKDVEGENVRYAKYTLIR